MKEVAKKLVVEVARCLDEIMDGKKALVDRIHSGNTLMGHLERGNDEFSYSLSPEEQFGLLIRHILAKRLARSRKEWTSFPCFEQAQ
jgi:hypothetical protein